METQTPALETAPREPRQELPVVTNEKKCSGNCEACARKRAEEGDSK
jgi:hypothetical protein